MCVPTYAYGGPYNMSEKFNRQFRPLADRIGRVDTSRMWDENIRDRKSKVIADEMVFGR